MQKFKVIKHKKVITCKEAIVERKIALKHELKTLLLYVDSKVIAVHLRGSDRVNMKSIKKIFRTKNIIFVDQKFLEKVELSKGIINPWNIDFCQYNLICLNILNNKFMSTNNGKYDEGIFFKTDELWDVKNIIIGEFGKNYESI